MKKILGLLLMIASTIATMDALCSEGSTPLSHSAAATPVSQEAQGFEREYLCPVDNCTFFASTQRQVDSHYRRVHERGPVLWPRAAAGS